MTTKVGDRLARVLADLGYASDRHEGALQLDRVCAVVNRKKSGGKNVTPNMLKGYIYNGKTLSLEVAALLAVTLGFPLNEIAYDERRQPRPGKNKTRGILDEIDRLVYRDAD